MKNSDCKAIILYGREESLKNVPFHNNAKAPLKRFLLVNDSISSGIGLHVALHSIRKKLPKHVPKYGLPHSHNCAELNIFSTESRKLVYEISFDGKKETIEITPEKPLLLFIPPKKEHSIRVKSGRGTVVCILFEGNYVNSLIPKNNF